MIQSTFDRYYESAADSSRFAAKTHCSVCWGEIRPDEQVLTRPTEDGGVLRCHASHGLTARVNGFRSQDAATTSPFVRLAQARRLPAKELAR